MFGVTSFSDFWQVASEHVWTDRSPEPGFAKFGFWHCVFSAWFCDLMLHIGMLDLTLLRFGKSANVGWCSALGMFAGHYFTWIVAGLLYALQLRHDPTDTSVKPGPMAQAVAGTNGLLCVIAAGWSTANPVMYEAGLAFQSLFGEDARTRVVTLCVGALAAVAGLFPALVMRVLDFLAYGGLVLMPMGVVIFCDCFLLPMFGVQSEVDDVEVTIAGRNAVIITWAATTVVTLPIAVTGVLEVFFAPLPGIFIAAAIYITISVNCGRRSARHNVDCSVPPLTVAATRGDIC